MSYNLHLLLLKQEPQQKVLLKLTDHHDPEKLQNMHQLYSHYHLAGDRNKWQNFLLSLRLQTLELILSSVMSTLRATKEVNVPLLLPQKKRRGTNPL